MDNIIYNGVCLNIDKMGNMPTIETEPMIHKVLSILEDYELENIETLRYVIEQYQKLVCEITNGRLSKLTYPAETIISTTEDVYREYYENESVKHGQWKWVNNFPDNYNLKCSACGNVQDCGRWDFCPYCGARMDLKEGD